MTFNNFRTFNLAVNFYHLVSKLKLTRHLQEQLNRAASSVALNLAEGNSRLTRADKVKFFNISYSSLKECRAILLLAQNRNAKINSDLDILAAHIYKLIKSWG
jgi:four helix bundle protein